MKAAKIVDKLLETIDAPPDDIGDYIEDVLPMHPTEGDIVSALTKRGFNHRAFDGVPPTPADYWIKPMPGGLLQVKQEGYHYYQMQYWPSGPWPGDVARARGDIRAVLREVDRLVHAFQ